MKRLLAGAAVLTFALLTLPQAAQAGDARFSLGIGLNFGGYYPYRAYRPYYPPPPVYYAPPPAYYYPPPPPQMVYAPPAYGPAPGYGPPQGGPPGGQCREFQTTVIVGGQPQPAYGTACLQPDGSWAFVR